MLFDCVVLTDLLLSHKCVDCHANIVHRDVSHGEILGFFALAIRLVPTLDRNVLLAVSSTLVGQRWAVQANTACFHRRGDV